jgi:ubiquinone/menaquinone biosynthesis C-methylase UbiE
MSENQDFKHEVRKFYNQIGWQEVSEGLFQNAHYEDLRPIARDYIHKCHLRVGRHLPTQGRFLLDAGSGPIQYPEYLEYSRNHEKRVCADISHTALVAARNRIGEHGLFVVSDISKLPFAAESFDGAVSLHTIHHLPESDHVPAYLEIFRVLTTGSSAALVNGWDGSPITDALDRLKTWMKARKGLDTKKRDAVSKETGTHVVKHDAKWLHRSLKGLFNYRVFVWRTPSVNVLRFFVREEWRGRSVLRLLFALEERLPRFFGEKGLYPLVVIQK